MHALVDAVHALVAAHPGETVVAVSHADVIKAIVAAATGTHLDLPADRHLAVLDHRDPLRPRGSHRPDGQLHGRLGRSGPLVIESFDFPDPEFLTVGTLGPRGQREFFLQARAEGQMVSLKVEKQQVAALADYLDHVLADLPPGDAGPAPTDLDLREPVVPAWAVGSIGIAYAEDVDRLIVVAESLPVDGDETTGQARFSLRREQVTALVERSRLLVAAGRPPCPFCGRPLEPRNADWCACRN
ncbi:MAG: DUF3090 family protein [Acidimicrobiales bacterium]